MNRKNIGIVTTWFERGAAYVSRQYQQVLEMEHDVYIYARDQYPLSDDAGWEDDSVHFAKRLWVPRTGGFNLSDFKNWLRQHNIDVVIFNEQHWWKPIMLCNQMGIKTIAYIDYYTSVTMPFFNVYDALLCNTKRHFEAFKWHSNTFYIPWGTDIELFKPATTKRTKDKKLTFFHSAGFSPYRKGTDLVLKSFYPLRKRAKLIIHSQLPIASVFPELKSLIDKLFHCGCLELICETVSAPGLYARADIYVYPSRLEGIGLTIAEALASGLPVVTTDQQPMNEFITQDNGRVVHVQQEFMREDGYYWPQSEASISSLTESMDFYINNLENILTYQCAARRSAESCFDWFKNAERLSEIVSNLELISLTSKLDTNKEIIAYEKAKYSFFSRLSRVAKRSLKRFF